MIEKMEVCSARGISNVPLPLYPKQLSPTSIRFHPLRRCTTHFPLLHNQTVFHSGLRMQYHRISSLRSTTSEEISTETTIFRRDEPKTVVDAQLVEKKEDYGSQLNEKLQEGSLFDNPLKLFKFLEDLNIKMNARIANYVTLILLKGIFVSAFSVTLGFDFELDYEETYSFLAFGGGGAVALWLVAAVISAIDSIPVLPKALELVGLGYTLWFSSRYLILKKNRDELFTRVEQLKQQILGSDDNP